MLGLPDTWTPIDDLVRAHSIRRTRMALDPGVAIPSLRRYFDPLGDYAGELFNSLESATAEADPNNRLTPGDLLAVGLLNMRIRPQQARELLTPGHERRTEACRLLMLIPTNVSLREVGRTLEVATAAGGALLSHMSDLQDTLREAGRRRQGGRAPANWVFASKLAARKRPILFPVRDNLVSAFLSSSGARSTRGEGPGNFRHDIQVFAHLAADDGVSELIQCVREGADVPPVVPDLRILDAALWMAALGG